MGTRVLKKNPQQSLNWFEMDKSNTLDYTEVSFSEPSSKLYWIWIDGRSWIMQEMSVTTLFTRIELKFTTNKYAGYIVWGKILWIHTAEGFYMQRLVLWWLCVCSHCVFCSGLLVAYCHRFDILTQSSRIYFVACTVGTYAKLNWACFLLSTPLNAKLLLLNCDKPSSVGIKGRQERTGDFLNFPGCSLNSTCCYCRTRQRKWKHLLLVKFQLTQLDQKQSLPR